MYIARLLYPVEVLGPGKRIGIWVCGCPHHCNGCANPDLWEFRNDKKISISNLLQLIEQIAESNKIDGFTITGGEPFFQPTELTVLLYRLKRWSSDILVFSGYYKEQIEKFCTLKDVAVLVDGPYIKERNHGLILRGSDNQRILILNDQYKERYQKYLTNEKSKIQNFLDGNSVISVGIHKPDFATKIKKHMERKGLIEGGINNEPLHSKMA